MASALQKLLRSSQPASARIIAALRPSQTPKPIVSSLHPQCHPPTAPIIVSGEEIEHSSSTVIFPSFPFGFASKPIFASGIFPVEGEGAGSEAEEDSRTTWADSVKKKRKRKMNKHKYQKLRKRNRRQS